METIVNISFAPHTFTLDARSRSRGIAHLGHGSSFVAKLESGLPVTIALLGASVGLNAGCFTQPGRRCMLTNGRQPTALLWGTPRLRPFKGFLVRWFEWLNATWPHPEHRIVNAANDATSMETIVPCLFSHLPASFDLLLIEGGSMFTSNTPGLMEGILRQLLLMHAPPAIVFVTVHCAVHAATTLPRPACP